LRYIVGGARLPYQCPYSNCNNSFHTGAKVSEYGRVSNICSPA
jgi:hypothetical protein